MIFLTFFTTCHIRCMCNLTRLKVKPLRAMRQKQKTLTKQTMASNLFPVWQRPLQGLHADSLSLFLSRDISTIFCTVSSTSSTSPRYGPRWLVLIITSWQAKDVTEIFEDHVTPASPILQVYQTFSGILLTPCWLLCCKSGRHWKCRESKEKYMTSPGSGFCEDPRIPKKSYTRMAWWNLAHKMWPGHGVISCTLQDLRRSSHSSFADVLPVKPWIQITS